MLACWGLAFMYIWGIIKVMKKILLKQGFTLIELLVVIAIIGLLTAMVTANFTAAKAKARDGKRISDIAQLQLVFEQAFDRCNTYPSVLNLDTIINTSSCPTLKLSYFISVIPTDPTTRQNYNLVVNGTNPTDYILKATLETSNSVLNEDIDTTTVPATLSAIGNCDDTAFYYCVVPK
jgi:prepilin-type N-terminal cleavage/methylation domain-containing protein